MLAAENTKAAFDLANIRADNSVDVADLDIFTGQYAQIRAQNIADDLNGDGMKDGYPNEAMFSRIDLNGDGKVTPDDLDVMCDAMHLTTMDCAKVKSSL
jgi:hypothetical protein